MFRCPTRHVRIPMRVHNKHITVILNSRILRFKSVCCIDVSAITSVLVSELRSFTRTYFGAKTILEYLVEYCTSSFLSHINANTRMTSSLNKKVRDYPRQKFNTSMKKDRRISNINLARPISTRCGATTRAPLP